MPEDDTLSTTSLTRRPTRRRTAKSAEVATPALEQSQLPVAETPPAADTPTPRRRRTRAASAADPTAATVPISTEPQPQAAAQAERAEPETSARKGAGTRARAPRKRSAAAAAETAHVLPLAEQTEQAPLVAAPTSGGGAHDGHRDGSEEAAAPQATEQWPAHDHQDHQAQQPAASDPAAQNGAREANGLAPSPGYDVLGGQSTTPPWMQQADQSAQPYRRFGEPRVGRFNRPNPGGQPPAPQQGGQSGRMRFDRPPTTPSGPMGRTGQDNMHQRQNQGQQGMHPRDRRPLQHPAHSNRPVPPQRGHTGQNGQPGQQNRGDRNRGGGYIVPGYGVPGYGQTQGMPPYTGRHQGQGRPDGRPDGRPRQPIPPAPTIPVKTVDVQGVLWLRGNTAELLDERGTLAQLATVSFADVQRMGLRSGDVIQAHAEERGARRQVVGIETVNGQPPEAARERPVFEQLTAISPRERITLEHGQRPFSCRIIDLFAPLGFGARALVVAPPKTGKTTFLRETAEAVLTNYPNVLVMACLVGERPEEVTDLRSALEPRGGLVYAASFDEPQERHAWLVQVTIERAKRVAEAGGHVLVLLDSLTRLARAENLTGRAMGRTLSGGIDAQALDTGRRAFGAARCLEEGGSLTIMATCLVDTGSRQDDVVYEEFKGTGNMEIYLSRELSQRRLFPAVDAVRSGTRKEELLLTAEELQIATFLRRRLADLPLQAATTQLLDALEKVATNEKLVQYFVKSGVTR